jgi:hypothetical protein
VHLRIQATGLATAQPTLLRRPDRFEQWIVAAFRTERPSFEHERESCRNAAGCPAPGSVALCESEEELWWVAAAAVCSVPRPQTTVRHAVRLSVQR